MHRLATGLALTLAAIFVPSTALAAPSALPAVKRTLTASSHSCVTSTYRAPMAGFLSARTGAPTGGDWDLAIRDARSKNTMATSNAFGSQEVAQTFVLAGQRLQIVGCHVSGGDSTFPVSIVFTDAKPPADARPSLVRVPTMNPSILRRLESLGLDVTENVRGGHADVVVPSAGKLDLLKKIGMPFQVRSLDLRKDFVEARKADARYTARMGAAGSPLPTGRTEYRTLQDYQDELKALVKDHPGSVRPVTLGTTYQGRAIQGVEISQNVDAPNDGRPTFLLVGEHHAREWPSAEIAMEFAHMLVDGMGSGDAQITALTQKERIVVVPIINVDGFNASRGTNPDPADTMINNGGSLVDNTGGASPYDWDTVEGVFVPFGGNLAYRRKNCDGFIPNGPNHEEQNLPCYYQVGVDPNRNYGQNWGGVGASSDPNTQSYRGAGQWSEPETQAVWKWSQTHNVTFMMTLHNVAALVLRPPGVHDDGKAPDEDRMKQLGDEMAADTGYTSEYGFQLYDTSGTTEDWQYGGQGAFGYTIEIGPEGGQFHMPYQVGVVDQWTGTGDRKGRGLRMALLRAAESAGNPGDHSVIQGAAPAGDVLRLKKNFNTDSAAVCTYAQGQFTSGSIISPLDCVSPGDKTSTPDNLNYTMVVPASNHFEWHVTPSTRPFVFRKVIPGQVSDKPYETKTWTAEDGDIKPDSFVEDNTTGSDQAQHSAERRFSVTEPNTQLVLDLSWTATPQDYDLYLYRVGDGGKLEPAGTGSGALGGSSGSSGNPNGVAEEITVDNATPGDYVARVVYYMTGADTVPGANDWTLALNRFRQEPDKVETGRENWTMSCETPDGTVLESREVYVERGQAVTEDFGCGGAVPTVDAPRGDAGAQPGAQQVAGTRSPAKPKKKLTKRAACIQKASKIKKKAKRKAAVHRCKRRYPTAAERRAAAKRKALAKKRAAAKRRAAHRRH